jgi:hypothetical protein
MFTVTSVHPSPKIHKLASPPQPHIKSLVYQVEDWLRKESNYSNLTLPGLSLSAVEQLEEEIRSKGLKFK